MRTETELRILQAELESLLAMQLPREALTPELLTRLVELTKLVSPDGWETGITRLKELWGLTDGEFAEFLGETPVTAPAIHTRPPFPTLVRDGWLARYLEYTADSEAPAHFHYGSVIAVLASVLNRRPLLEWAEGIYPNLFVLIVGPTGSRKSSAARRAISTVSGSLLTVPELPSEGSPQGYARILEHQIAQTGSAQGLVFASEYNVLLGGEKYKSELSKWLTDWYDCPVNWSRALSTTGICSLTNVYVSLLGCSTLAWLRRVPQDAISGGFIPRHLLFDAEGPRHRKAVPRYNTTLLKELQDVLPGRFNDIPDVMGLSDDAASFITNYYEKLALEEVGSDLYQAWQARFLAHVLKLATVWQLVDGGSKYTLDVEHIVKAKGVVEWCTVGVKEIYSRLGVTQEGAPVEAVLHLLRSTQGWLPYITILRELYRQYDATTISKSLASLRAAGLAETKRDTVGPVWRLAKL